MEQVKYNLDWDSHSDYLRNMLHEMRKKDDMTDVTLVCDDKKQIKAHKIILSACSSVFKNIIGEHTFPIIYLRGIQQQEIESILEFMYLGEATLSQSRMDEFLKIATDLEIKELSKNLNLERDEMEHIQVKTEEPEINIEIDEGELNNYEAHKTKQFEKSSANEVDQNDSNDSQTKCPKCEKVFSHRSNMRRHYKSVHKDVTDVNAGESGTGVDMHNGESEEDAEKSMDENYSNIFQTEQSESPEIEVNDSSNSETKCPKCEKAFSHRSNMRRHYKSVHKGITQTPLQF